MTDATTAAAAATATTATTAAATTTTATTAAQPWYQGIADVPPEFVGRWQTMGLDKKSAAEAAVAVTKSYLEAQKFIGVPENQLLRMPKDAADEQGWQALRTRLGVPTDPTQYDQGIKGVKFTDGTELDQGFVEFSRSLAAKLHLPANDAAELTKGIVTHLEKVEAAENAEKAAALAESKKALDKSWGANAAANRLIAQNAAQRLGIDPSAVSALEGVVGYDKVMNMFLNLGQRMGEDKFISGGGTGVLPGGALSKEQAQAQLAELKQDKAFVAKYLDGDREARRQMDALHQLIAA